MSNMFLLTILVVVAVIFLGGCASVVHSTKNLPDDYTEIADPPLNMPEFDVCSSNIGSVYSKELKDNPDGSGAVLIENGVYALLHRVALARMAKYTIELQTYIYENDLVSRLLMRELKAAADRGVIVRIIVDDNGLDSDHSDIMTLDYHPNIEVKVFNPFKYRSRALRYPQYAVDLPRVNYRMHNKLYIVDGIATIIGGRNVAANYFDANAVMNFSDTDVLFIGKIAKDSLESFNKYWDYHKSVPARAFPDQNKPHRLNEIDAEIAQMEVEHPVEYMKYQRLIDEFILHYNAKDYEIYWGNGTLIADNPDKSEGHGEKSPIMTALRYLWSITEKSVYISSAYLVPGMKGTQNIIDAAKKGLEVNILTNSLSSTDAFIVYSVWRKYRDMLVSNGINVYEFRSEGYKVKSQISSGASLHSKAIVFDDKISWVGSFNLDPRSADINTEVVAAFNCPEFAVKLRENIEKDMSPEHSWHLTGKKGNIIWTTVRDGKEEVFDRSPDTSLGTRFLMMLMTLMPEGMI